MTASRVVLRGGDEMFVTLAPDEVLSHGMVSSSFMSTFVTLPLLSMDGGPPRSVHVRRVAVDAIEPLDERELEAYRRDREEWITHG